MTTPKIWILTITFVEQDEPLVYPAISWPAAVREANIFMKRNDLRPTNPMFGDDHLQLSTDTLDFSEIHSGCITVEEHDVLTEEVPR